MEEIKNEKQRERLEQFLLFDYFKITKKDDDSVIENLCADRAYLDMCRTLRFNKGCEGLSDKKKKFREDVICIIINGIRKLEKEHTEPNKYDEIHQSICEDIEKKAEDLKLSNMFQESFNFGQAQKWLNMTIKYLWLLGLWNSETEWYTHIPIDSYIITAAEEIEGVKNSLPKIKGNKDDDIKAWSKWDGKYDQEAYKKVQELIREYAESKGESPLEWEHEAWLKQSSKKSN